LRSEEATVARLFKGERENKTKRVEGVLRGNDVTGVTESEAADLLGWERRTVNNYLRELERSGKAEKKGRSWFRHK
jgi:hypothetical protein